MRAAAVLRARCSRRPCAAPRRPRGPPRRPSAGSAGRWRRSPRPWSCAPDAGGSIPRSSRSRRSGRAHRRSAEPRPSPRPARRRRGRPRERPAPPTGPPGAPRPAPPARRALPARPRGGRARSRCPRWPPEPRMRVLPCPALRPLGARGCPWARQPPGRLLQSATSAASPSGVSSSPASRARETASKIRASSARFSSAFADPQRHGDALVALECVVSRQEGPVEPRDRAGLLRVEGRTHRSRTSGRCTPRPRRRAWSSSRPRCRRSPCRGRWVRPPSRRRRCTRTRTSRSAAAATRRAGCRGSRGPSGARCGGRSRRGRRGPRRRRGARGRSCAPSRRAERTRGAQAG